MAGSKGVSIDCMYKLDTLPTFTTLRYACGKYNLFHSIGMGFSARHVNTKAVNGHESLELVFESADQRFLVRIAENP
jgi:hypothetical protein